jgi:hypothetical protein
MRTESLIAETTNPKPMPERLSTVCATTLLPLLLLLAMPAAVQAQFTFTTNFDSTITIMGYTGSGGAVTIPDWTNGLPVTSIGDEAFAYCTSLTNVTIPNSVTSIGDCAFRHCTSLTAITVDPINPAYSSLAGVLFDKSWTTLIECPAGKAGSYPIPNSVTYIEHEAFGYCASLTSVTMGNTVTSIGNYAFRACANLTNVMIGNRVTSIGEGAFWDCTSLTNVTIGNSVTSIGADAFEGCTSLASVTIPTSVTNIGQYAFGWCSGLTNVTLGNSVTGIGYGAFYSCTSLTGVTIPNSVISIGASAFWDCTSLTSLTIPNSVTSIGASAFFECSSLTSVTIGNSVTSIGACAFLDCTSLTSITIPNSATSLGEGAFFECSSLTSVTIGNSVTNIGKTEFCYCSSLTSVTIPNSVTSIGGDAFADCYSLTGVYFQGNAPSLGSSVFDGDNNATAYYLPGTKGWNPQVQTGGTSFGVQTNQFGFTIAGNSNLGVVVEACTNLTQPAWSPVGTNTLTAGASFFSDPQWTNYPARFYRLCGLTFAALPAVLWNPQVQTSGASFGVGTNGFGFTIVGSSNLVIVVEACTNLANPLWFPVGTNTLTGGSSYFSDSQWTNYATRFYRLRSP